MRPAPSRPRPRLPRLSPLTVAVVVLALLSAAVTHQLTSAAIATRDRLGTTVDVWVVAAPIDAGEPITSANAALEARPGAFVPQDAAADVVGATARVALGPGEVVSARHLAVGLSGVATLLPDGWRGVAVPVYDAVPPLEPGDAVDVHATVDPLLAADGGPSSGLVVDRAVVVAVRDDAITIAVPADRVAGLAFALTNAAITLVLRA